MDRSVAQTATYDAGLRSFMVAVFNRVGLGVLGMALLAWLAANTPIRDALFIGSGKATHYTALGWIVSFGPLFLLVGMGMASNLANRANAAIVYWGCVALFGLSFGSIFLRFHGISIATTFAETALAFGGMSLFGYVTKRDLSGWGVFLMMGLIGIIIALVGNIFIQSSAIAFVVNIIGILIFAGLTAYDTQKLKDYYSVDSDSHSGLAYMASLSLLLDFVNMFQFLLNMNSSDD